MNLVVGATGLLGGEICRQLADGGEPVRALVRTSSDPEKVASLAKREIAIVRGDVKDRASLDAACRGARAVISTMASTTSSQPGDSIETVDSQGQQNLIDAARAAGVDHFVLISFQPIPIEFPFQTAKRAAERRLRESGMGYTVLQPVVFMEVWLSPALGFDPANAKAQIYGTGERPTSWISLSDVARYAVASLRNPAARNAVIELGGPEALSPLQVVQLFEQIGGRTFDVQHVPEAALRAQYDAATDPLQKSFAALMLSYARGMVVDGRDARRIFPDVRLTPVRDYAQRVAARQT